MSYEGFTFYICEDGHLDGQDSLSDDYQSLIRCRCGKKLGWLKHCDETNGCDCYDGFPRLCLACRPKLMLKKPAVFDKYNKDQYFIPSYVDFEPLDD